MMTRAHGMHWYLFAMRRRGFTLIELMIVVTIIGVLAVLAGTAYRRYANKARSSEVYAMFAEFRAKQEAYRTEFSRYCNTQTNCATMASEAVFFPALIAGGEPKAKPIAGRPQGWIDLGINPGKNDLYCGYVSVAGSSLIAGSWAAAGAYGQQWFNNVQPTGPWWYLVGTCDNNGAVAANTIYVTGVDKSTVFVDNEGM